MQFITNAMIYAESVLELANDLIKNDGKQFLEMMEKLKAQPSNLPVDPNSIETGQMPLDQLIPAPAQLPSSHAVRFFFFLIFIGNKF